jgi:hypothetical protein
MFTRNKYDNTGMSLMYEIHQIIKKKNQTLPHKKRRVSTHNQSNNTVQAGDGERSVDASPN